jgi:hypothetical protein
MSSKKSTRAARRSPKAKAPVSEAARAPARPGQLYVEDIQYIAVGLKRLRSRLSVCMGALKSPECVDDDVAEILDEECAGFLSDLIDRVEAAAKQLPTEEAQP